MQHMRDEANSSNPEGKVIYSILKIFLTQHVISINNRLHDCNKGEHDVESSLVCHIYLGMSRSDSKYLQQCMTLLPIIMK